MHSVYSKDCIAESGLTPKINHDMFSLALWLAIQVDAKEELFQMFLIMSVILRWVRNYFNCQLFSLYIYIMLYIIFIRFCNGYRVKWGQLPTQQKVEVSIYFLIPCRYIKTIFGSVRNSRSDNDNVVTSVCLSWW